MALQTIELIRAVDGISTLSIEYEDTTGHVERAEVVNGGTAIDLTVVGPKKTYETNITNATATFELPSTPQQAIFIPVPVEDPPDIDLPDMTFGVTK